MSMDNEDYVSVSDSKFWRSWRESRVYKLQVSVLSGEIMMSAKCDLKPSHIDPYLVIYPATRDREHSKKKTQVIKRSTSPVWNECICFSDLDYTESICFELKIPAFSLSNPLLGHLSLTVQEMLSTPVNDINDYSYAFISDVGGVEVSVRLGFKFDTPLVGVEASSGADTTVFMNSHGAFASFVFFPSAGGAGLQQQQQQRGRGRVKFDGGDYDTDFDDA